ncbi:hypothetical protein B0I31_1163 [Saccharothrix carnea]|uniref:Uncharacterized protein n=1 Tax=Saccharothrix carnea TaxID=1280637 RepID=A0A2P8I0C6_SACCR|nr:DUF5988 family protein [Saccharothrix carnea]PSL51927.1 hypothetical protein B0I31_1163 [Saccharothrix carnea]
MNKIKVVLVGGPEQLREDDRIRYVTDLADKVKVPAGNGYEHFRANGESRTVDDFEVPVFAWCGRTKIAE